MTNQDFSSRRSAPATSSIAILVTMIFGFITVVFSVVSLIRSDMNRRFDEQKEETSEIISFMILPDILTKKSPES